MKIIVDAFGGDNAPLEILKGCEMAVKKYGVDILLTGDEAVIRRIATERDISLACMDIVNAPDVITMSDHPNSLRKEKKDSSLAVGLRLLSEGEGDGFVSAGSTGAILVGATTIVGRIKGVKRPALAPVIPKSSGVFMLIDCGANADCRPDMLAQFAKMGSIYMERVIGVSSPRIGLANIGTEDTKGDELRIAAFPLLKEAGVNFIGNVEARDIPYDACDVVVTDGFTGNILLKMYEGVAGALMDKIKGVMTGSVKNKLAAAVMLRDFKAMKKELDYNEYGGAPFLGVKAPVFKAHGSSKADTFCSAIGQMVSYIDSGAICELTDAFQTSGLIDRIIK